MSVLKKLRFWKVSFFYQFEAFIHVHVPIHKDIGLRALCFHQSSIKWKRFWIEYLILCFSALPSYNQEEVDSDLAGVQGWINKNKDELWSNQILFIAHTFHLCMFEHIWKKQHIFCMIKIHFYTCFITFHITALFAGILLKSYLRFLPRSALLDKACWSQSHFFSCFNFTQ